MTTNARLRALVELADTGSVRGAAERLVVTESAISSAISSLSADVGVALVDRYGRGAVSLLPDFATPSTRAAFLACMMKRSGQPVARPTHRRARSGWLRSPRRANC